MFYNRPVRMLLAEASELRLRMRLLWGLKVLLERMDLRQGHFFSDFFPELIFMTMRKVGE